jgi:hypothetical protein
VFLFLIFIFLTSCSHKHDYIGVVDTVVSKETNKIRKEEGVELFGYGGAMMEGIENIRISFVSHQKVDIAEARQMIVRYIERIRDAVNAKNDLKEYLIPYPFPTSGINMSILFLQDSGKFIEYGCVWLGTGGVSSVSQIDGNIFYSSYNPRTELLEHYYRETYEEALAIVNNEESNNCSEQYPLTGDL